MFDKTLFPESRNGCMGLVKKPFPKFFDIFPDFERKDIDMSSLGTEQSGNINGFFP